jgi:hypothetical protein
VLVDGSSSSEESLLRFLSGNAGDGVIFIVVGILAESADLLHDGFQKPLGDLARRKAGHLGIDHGLDKLAGGHTDALDTISDAVWKTP